MAYKPTIMKKKTQSDRVDDMFELFLKSTNSKRAQWIADQDGKLRVKVGTLSIDKGHGGYNIEQMSNEMGGVSHPFGPVRRSTTDMILFLSAMIDLINWLEKKK